jgi:hypothetical protein
MSRAGQVSLPPSEALICLILAGEANAVMLYAFGDSESAQKAAAKILSKRTAGFLKRS